MRRIKQFMSRTVNKLLLVAAAVLLFVSISGFVTAFVFPTEIEESVALVSYQHEGEFDYIAYLKPSHLFGPEPQEPPPPPPPPPLPPPPPPNPVYFTEIIDSFDMAFSYIGEWEISAEVEVTAILENPGMWQKEITLVPKTTRIGYFGIDFPLDIDELHEEFDTIDEEIKITSQERKVTIVVNVLAGDDVFTQSLPIDLGYNTIEVDSNLRLTQAGATGEFDYTVYLKENSLFDTETLKPPPPVIPPPPPTPPPSPPPPPPKTIGAGELLFSKLTDKMDMTFSYKFKSDKPVSQVAEEVEIKAVLENPEVWSKTFVLVPLTKTSGDFTSTFSLDINEVMEMLETIRSETGVSAESYNVTIMADVHTVAQTEFGPIDEVFSQTMSTTLGEGTLDWSEELISTKPGFIEESRMIPNEFLGLSVSDARTLFSVLTGVFLAVSVLLFILYVMYGPAKLPEMDREALRARKKYKDLIIDIQGLPTTTANERVISLSSLDDLITIAEELGKVVLHKAEKEKHTYCIIDVMIRYEYVSELELPSKDKLHSNG